MHKLVSPLLVSLLVPTLLSAAVPPSREELLSGLKVQLAAIRTATVPLDPLIDRPDPSALVGARRGEISADLGRPDFCPGGPPSSCDSASQWDFFYFKKPPAAVNHGGNAEVNVTGGGGWALILHFNDTGTVRDAGWSRQE